MATTTTNPESKGVNLYNITIPPFIRSMRNLLAIMDKAEEYATAQKLPHEYFLFKRVHPDMQDFIYQIQRLSESAKGVVTQIAGHDAESMENNERTLPELKARLEKTINILEKVRVEEMAGMEGKEVVLRPQNLPAWVFNAQDFIITFAIPKFYFHVTTAYGILRSCGLPIGMMDYLGPLVATQENS